MSYIHGLNGIGYYTGFLVVGLTDDGSTLNCLFCFPQPLDEKFNPRICESLIPENMVISNRFRTIDLQVCGTDGRCVKFIQTEGGYPVADTRIVRGILKNNGYRCS